MFMKLLNSMDIQTFKEVEDLLINNYDKYILMAGVLDEEHIVDLVGVSQTETRLEISLPEANDFFDEIQGRLSNTEVDHSIKENNGSLLIAIESPIKEAMFYEDALITGC